MAPPDEHGIQIYRYGDNLVALRLGRHVAPVGMPLEAARHLAEKLTEFLERNPS